MLAHAAGYAQKIRKPRVLGGIGLKAGVVVHPAARMAASSDPTPFVFAVVHIALRLTERIPEHVENRVHEHRDIDIETVEVNLRERGNSEGGDPSQFLSN